MIAAGPVGSRQMNLPTAVFSSNRSDLNQRGGAGLLRKGAVRAYQAQIEAVAKEIDSYLRSTQKDLKIEIHEETGQVIAKIISRDDGKVVREVPDEDLLDLAARLDTLRGVVFNKTA